MRFHKPIEEGEDVQPCSHMRDNISTLSDGSLSGLMLWYTRAHVSQCEHCNIAFQRMVKLREDLRTLQATDAGAELSPEQQAILAKQLDVVEQGGESGKSVV